MVVIDCGGHRYTGTTFSGPRTRMSFGARWQKVTDRVVWQPPVVFPYLAG
jgi:hypothetical protein